MLCQNQPVRLFAPFGKTSMDETIDRLPTQKELESMLQIVVQDSDVDGVASHIASSSGNLNAKNTDGRTLLSLAAGSGDARMTWLLLASWAYPNILCNEKRSPLLYAAVMGDV
ncbi:hypothetical protein MW887_000832 [Aspergillus wentii]|nr:hypothetical protein MW887_000832 [Aspergillus wentii]